MCLLVSFQAGQLVGFLFFLKGPEFILIILTPTTRCGLKCVLKARLSTILINIGKKVMMLVKMAG